MKRDDMQRKKMVFFIVCSMSIILTSISIMCSYHWDDMPDGGTPIVQQTCKSILVEIQSAIVYPKSWDAKDTLKIITFHVSLKGNSNDAASLKEIFCAEGMRPDTIIANYPKNMDLSCEGKNTTYVSFGPEAGRNRPLYDTNGNEITDAWFFHNKKVTLHYEFIPAVGDPWTGSDTITAQHLYWKDACNSQKLLQIPTLKVSTFNSDDCTCTLTVYYAEEIDSAIYSVFLHASPKKKSVPIGGLQVDAPGKNITAEIHDGKYIWEAKGAEVKVNEPQYFQICVQATEGKCNPSLNYSLMETSFDVTCVSLDPVVQIGNIKDKNNHVLNFEMGEELEPKGKGPFTIGVYAKTDDQEIPTSIKLEVSYDSAVDLERTDYYLDRHPENKILKTITLTPDTLPRDFIYHFTWDGRDDFDGRILLGGDYIMTATATFGVDSTIKALTKSAAIREGTHAENVPVDKVRYFVNVGVDYPGSDTAIINKARKAYADNAYEFSKVPILNKGDTTFEWLRKFSLLSNNCDLSEYSRMNKGGPYKITNDLMDIIKDSAAIFNYIGHASGDTNAIGSLIFHENRLYPICGDSGYASKCATPEENICLDYDCDGNSRGGKIFDDVLLAVLLGCRTGLGARSVAAMVDSNGADCVIATKTRVDRMAMNFWYREFTKRLILV